MPKRADGLQIADTTIDGVIFMEEGKKKVLIVATVVKTHIMQFHIPTMKMLHENRWTVEVAARNDYENPEDCSIPYCDRYYNIQFERSPFSRQNIKAYKELKKIIDCGDYDVVHCHTPVGGVLGRLASRKARKNGTKVFYTAHGFHFYKGGPISSWLIYYPIEKYCAHFTDKLITINQEDYELAKKRMKAKEIVYIPGVGIDTKRFSNSAFSVDEVRMKREELGVKDDERMLVSVGELIPRKNHSTVIKALYNIQDRKWKYYICGQGELFDELNELIASLNLSQNVFLLGYRSDISSILCSSDLFIFPSLQEGLPVALMEAIACKVPIICSDIRGNNELILGQSLFDPEDIKEISDMIEKHLTVFSNELVEENYCRLRKYDLKNVNSILEHIYRE